MPETKLYAERDVEDLPMYAAHVSAIAAGNLNGEAAIASELAFRDNTIHQKDIELDEIKILLATANRTAVEKFADNMAKLAAQQDPVEDEVMLAIVNTCTRLARMYAERVTT